MEKLFKKYDTLFSILLIIIYLIINMICINTFGMFDYRTTIINTIFSILIIILMITFKRIKYYGLTKPKYFKETIYFIPLLIIISVNLWEGININNTKKEIIFYILTMINIGFLEEIIFRGFLFKMMSKDNVNSAIIVTSITFGIGHFINLFNGASFIPTIFQIISAISIGYLFVTIFHKTKSLIPSIITHILINSLSIFTGSNELIFYISSTFLIIFPLLYSMYINIKIKTN